MSEVLQCQQMSRHRTKTLRIKEATTRKLAILSRSICTCDTRMIFQIVIALNMCREVK